MRTVATTVGEFIREWRRLRRRTQADVAAALGCGQTTVSNWEVGVTDISRQDFVRLAALLEIPEGEWPAGLRLPVRPAA